MTLIEELTKLTQELKDIARIDSIGVNYILFGEHIIPQLRKAVRKASALKKKSA